KAFLRAHRECKFVEGVDGVQFYRPGQPKVFLLIAATTILTSALWLASYKLITREGNTLSGKVSTVVASDGIPRWLCYFALPLVAWRSEEKAQLERLRRLADPLRPYRAAARIQNWWRPLYDQRRRCRAEVTIAACWRGYAARREAHRRLLAIVQIQSAGRCLIAKNKAGERRRDRLMAEMAAGKDDKTISHGIGLLSRGKLVRANRPSNATGQTLAMTAALYDFPLSLDLLFHRLGAEALEERDRYGWTCLHYAVEGTSLRCCEVVISTEKELGVERSESLLQAEITSPTQARYDRGESISSTRVLCQDDPARPGRKVYSDELARREEGSLGESDSGNDGDTPTRSSSSSSDTHRLGSGAYQDCPPLPIVTSFGILYATSHRKAADVIQAVALSRVQRRKTVSADGSIASLNLNKFGEEVLQDLLDYGYDIVEAAMTSSEEGDIVNEGDLNAEEAGGGGGPLNPHAQAMAECKEWLWSKRAWLRMVLRSWQSEVGRVRRAKDEDDAVRDASMHHEELLHRFSNFFIRAESARMTGVVLSTWWDVTRQARLEVERRKAARLQETMMNNEVRRRAALTSWGLSFIVRSNGAQQRGIQGDAFYSWRSYAKTMAVDRLKLAVERKQNSMREWGDKYFTAMKGVADTVLEKEALLKVTFRGWKREVDASRLFQQVTTEQAARSQQAETKLMQQVDCLSSRLLEVTTSVWTVHLVLIAWKIWAREEVFERHLDSVYSVAQESRLALADGFLDHAKDRGVERLKRQAFGGWKTEALLLVMEQRELELRRQLAVSQKSIAHLMVEQSTRQADAYLLSSVVRAWFHATSREVIIRQLEANRTAEVGEATADAERRLMRMTRAAETITAEYLTVSLWASSFNSWQLSAQRESRERMVGVSKAATDALDAVMVEKEKLLTKNEELRTEADSLRSEVDQLRGLLARDPNEGSASSSDSGVSSSVDGFKKQAETYNPTLGWRPRGNPPDRSTIDRLDLYDAEEKLNNGEYFLEKATQVKCLPRRRLFFCVRDIDDYRSYLEVFDNASLRRMRSSYSLEDVCHASYDWPNREISIDSEADASLGVMRSLKRKTLTEMSDDFFLSLIKIVRESVSRRDHFKKQGFDSRLSRGGASNGGQGQAQGRASAASVAGTAQRFSPRARTSSAAASSLGAAATDKPSLDVAVGVHQPESRQTVLVGAEQPADDSPPPELGMFVRPPFFHCLLPLLLLIERVAASEAVQHQQLFPDVPPRASVSQQCAAYAPIEDISVSEASAIFYASALWNRSPEFPTTVPSGLILYSSTNPFSYSPAVVKFEQLLAGSFPDIRFYRVNLVGATQAELLQLQWITVPRVIILSAVQGSDTKAFAASIDPPFDADKAVAYVANVTGLEVATSSNFYRSAALYSDEYNIKLHLDWSVFSLRDWTGLVVLAYTCINFTDVLFDQLQEPCRVEALVDRRRSIAIICGVAAAIGLAVYLFRDETEDEREEASRKKAAIPPGKRPFYPTTEWQKVEADQVCPAGLDFKMDVSTGESFARLSSK
ncbi:hypothetical protein FOZ63_008941, partial [Perkinsus olseni]